MRNTSSNLRDLDFSFVIPAKAGIPSLLMKFKEKNYEESINFFCGWVLRCPCQ